MSETDILRLCDIIRQNAFDLHAYLRHGHLENVYQNGLANRLRKSGVKVEQQCPIKVYDQDGTVLEEYFADLVIRINNAD
jgi:GxxExxY protein